MKKLLKYCLFGSIGFLIGRGFQIALDYPCLYDYVDKIEEDYFSRYGRD